MVEKILNEIRCSVSGCCAGCHMFTFLL
jgi:hypothetical protein